jgi:hypothetical protein
LTSNARHHSSAIDLPRRTHGPTDTCVVDQHIDRAVPRQKFSDCLLEAIGIKDIRVHGNAVN